MEKSLGTLLRFESVFQFIQIHNPCRHPTNNVGHVYPEFFCEFQLCIGWGEGELQKHFENDALFY